MDVNGQAASIELYLGCASLTVNGELRPVRWTGYIQAARGYQGEVEGKTEPLSARARVAAAAAPMTNQERENP